MVVNAAQLASYSQAKEGLKSTGKILFSDSLLAGKTQTKLTCSLLSMPTILMFAIALEALYARSWTGPMLFSRDCSMFNVVMAKYMY